MLQRRELKQERKNIADRLTVMPPLRSGSPLRRFIPGQACSDPAETTPHIVLCGPKARQTGSGEACCTRERRPETPVGGVLPPMDSFFILYRSTL